MTDLHVRAIFGKIISDIESGLLSKVSAQIIKRGPNFIIFKSSGTEFTIKIEKDESR